MRIYHRQQLLLICHCLPSHSHCGPTLPESCLLNVPWLAPSREGGTPGTDFCRSIPRQGPVGPGRVQKTLMDSQKIPSYLWDCHGLYGIYMGLSFFLMGQTWLSQILQVDRWNLTRLKQYSPPSYMGSNWLAVSSSPIPEITPRQPIFSDKYPLVMSKQLLKMTIEIVDFPVENGGSFHSYVNVYQRVDVP